MAMGDRSAAALAPRRTAAKPGHFGRYSALVDEHQPLGIEIGLALEPGQPSGRYVRPVLFGCVRSLFLRVMSCRRKNRCTMLGSGR